MHSLIIGSTGEDWYAKGRAQAERKDAAIPLLCIFWLQGFSKASKSTDDVVDGAVLATCCV